MSVGAYVLDGMGPTTTPALFVMLGFGTAGTPPVPTTRPTGSGGGGRFYSPDQYPEGWEELVEELRKEEKRAKHARRAKQEIKRKAPPVGVSPALIAEVRSLVSRASTASKDAQASLRALQVQYEQAVEARRISRREEELLLLLMSE